VVVIFMEFSVFWFRVLSVWTKKDPRRHAK
jgi:hypothetical protein